MKKVIFVTYGGGHVKALLPIIKKLQSEGKYAIQVLGLTVASKILKNNNIECINLIDLIENKEVIDIGKKLALKEHNKELGVSYNESIAYYGIGMYYLIKQHGERKAYDIFNSIGRKSFLPIEFFYEVLKNNSVDLLVTTSSPRFEEASLLAADKLGIKSIRIEQLFAQGNTPILENTTYCVLNEFVKNKLLEKGIEKSRILVTGQPAFDSMDIDEKQLKLLKKDIMTDKKIVLWISPGNKDNEHILRYLIDLEKERNDIKLIIKIHPNETENIYKEIIRTSESSAIIARENLHELILLSDVVIVEVSAVGLETILLDKELITINFTGEKDRVPYAQTGAAKGVYKIEELEESIVGVLYNEIVRAELKKNRKSYKIGRKATQNIYEIINKLLG